MKIFRSNLRNVKEGLWCSQSHLFFLPVLTFLFVISRSSLFSQTTSSYSQSGGTATKTGQAYSSSTTDLSGVSVTNSGTFTLTYSSVKTTGNTTSMDSSSFYGLNAGVLAGSSSTIYLSNSSVVTSGSGANGVFSTGSGSLIVLTDDTISCIASGAHGVDATAAGTLTMTDVIITTAGNGAAAAIATDRGGGTITGTHVMATSSGTTSPAIYSTGAISISNSTLAATQSEGAVIEGFNTVTLTNTSLTGSNPQTGGVMIYQSMSGDASVGTGTFTMTGGTLTATACPLFFITNTNAAVFLTGTTVNAASGILVQAAATSRWGTAGSNGGTISFTANDEALNGALEVDSLSSITVNLKDSTTLTGAINAVNKAKSDMIVIDGTSKWTATANSYITSLTTVDSDTSNVKNYVDANAGVFIYYAPSANSWLGGRTYTLTSGGYLAPSVVTAVHEIQTGVSSAFVLSQNYPNPFNPTTTILFSVPSKSFVSLKVFDSVGREVATIISEEMPAGNYSRQWNAANMSSGMYFYRLQAGSFTETKKLLLLK